MDNTEVQPQKMIARLTILSVLIISSASLKITCGGRRHQQDVPGYQFRGCFVTKENVAYEILGKPPANISGPYGTMLISKTYDCTLHLKLGDESVGIYKYLMIRVINPIRQYLTISL